MRCVEAEVRVFFASDAGAEEQRIVDVVTDVCEPVDDGQVGSQQADWPRR